ncbi:MAG TPA: N-formylglutamate amidohydrolase [Acidimicrobiia bacterium]|nr:N-formylglutamate amidohydrolase [Acidimicrobiia bacterium]
MNPPFVVVDDVSPIMATAIHAGHSLRPEIAERIALPEEVRFREEDPYTDLLTEVVPFRVVVDRSRFEIDLNRPRGEAIYAGPDQAWGLEVWTEPLEPQAVATSLDIYDWFYQEIGQRLDALAALTPFVVLDIHSYNHRRDGADSPPADPIANPDVNIGTGSLDRSHWASLVDRFTDDLGRVLPSTATVAENVRFKGGYFSQWIDERYAGRGCALALEFKKVFMDEWSGEVNLDHVGRLREALMATVPGLLSEINGRR